MIHIVLYQPEIPANTGNIMRTCMATNTRLHLIKPLGFSLDEKHVRRSGMDYRFVLNTQLYEDFETFEAANPGIYFFVTRYGKQPPSGFDFSRIEADIYLIFGRESTGIPKPLLRAHLDRCMRIPMHPEARSLNLSNSVAIVVYEVLRQRGYPDLSAHEVIKGADWLERE
jgi:tRNA (cytidine/uridine-2'-O-)-methyltransferase